ncbi:MAG: LacI family DNA-binding transcriptional regulator [Lachnospirales bacterium]
MATSKDVAKLAGVSHTTVSRAFRKDPRVKAETYELIMKISEEIGYVPNQIASSLRKRKTNTICFIVSLSFNPLFLELTRIIETELAKKGYRLLISFDNEDSDLQWSILQSLSSFQVDCVIFTPLVKNNAQREKMGKWMKQTGIHFIQLVSDVYDDITSFNFDDNVGSYIGTKYLLTNGHKNILMAGGVNRIFGYNRAYSEFGVTPKFPYYDVTDITDDETYENIKNAILTQKPTAIFAISTSITYMVIEALSELKIKFPKDISLLTFDDARWQKLLKISAIGHPVEAFANAIVREVLNLENGNNQYPTNTTFKPFLIERNSVKQYTP